LRINNFSDSREEVMKTLASSGIEASPTPYSPLGLRVKGKPALNRHALFLKGKIEVQDEGSQLIGLLVAPRRGEMVADFCAGAGGKTCCWADAVAGPGARCLEKRSPALPLKRSV
jgi:16S rRNA (cytosine967-C5)-methyltransferase